MNTVLRTKILIISLDLEDALSNLLIALMNIRKPDKKTLGNKSSSISFKNKVDFLYDLDRISKEDYNKLILFMEIRNQFIHNKEADSFQFVLSQIEKMNSLLNIDSEIRKSYNNSLADNEKEKWLDLAFDKLHLDLIAIIIDQNKRLLKEKDLEIEKETNKKLLGTYEFLLNSINDSIKEFKNEFSEAFTNDKKVQDDLKSLIDSIFYKKLKEKIEPRFGQIEYD
jgi:hypothetical protein